MKETSSKYRGPRTCVLLFSKYQIVSEGLKHLIEFHKDLTVVAVHSLGEGLEKLARLKVDVAVVHLSYGDSSEIIVEILRLAPDLRILVVGAYLDLETQVRIMKLGVFGIIRSEQRPSALVEAIRRTQNGEISMNRSLLAKLVAQNGQDSEKHHKSEETLSIESLTMRERQVIKHIGEGLKNKDIAKRLLISEATVRHHLSSIYGKIGVDDRLNLVIFAFERGLIDAREGLGDQSHNGHV